jgi:GNAT superfamily N-acetyltransferase
VSTASSAPSELLPSEVARYEEVCRFGQDRLEPLARTVSLAFADDPIWQWILGIDRTLELDEAITLGRMLVADTSPADEIHGFRHHDAVALWRAPADQNTEAMQEHKERQSGPHRAALIEQIGDRAALLPELGAAMRAARPEEPHWYLSILGTAPARQNQGLGHRVMAPMLERCDRLGMMTYLESSNPRNHAFYLRSGYVASGEISGGGSPPIMRFIRTPK